MWSWYFVIVTRDERWYHQFIKYIIIYEYIKKLKHNFIIYLFCVYVCRLLCVCVSYAQKNHLNLLIFVMRATCHLWANEKVLKIKKKICTWKLWYMNFQGWFECTVDFIFCRLWCMFYMKIFWESLCLDICFMYVCMNTHICSYIQFLIGVFFGCFNWKTNSRAENWNVVWSRRIF